MSTIRLDRFISLCVFHPLVKRMPGRTAQIPILMYHSISEDDDQRRHPYYATGTSPRTFAEQMKFLYDMGYSVITLDDVVRCVGSGNQGAKRSVAITFDDGYRDFYTHAFPILSKYGFSATVFLPTAYIGHTVLRFKGKECLTWAEVRTLHGAGITFGSHTATHPQLRVLTREAIESELRCSRTNIEDQIGESVHSFSYPFAFPEADRELIQCLGDLLEKNGFENGVCTVIGTAAKRDNRFFLPRLPVNSWDDVRLFQAKLQGGYDWLHSVQYASKRLGAKIGDVQLNP